MASATQDLEHCDSEKSQSDKTDTFVNSFANDGSFFEIYKQRLKEQQAATNETKEVHLADALEKEKRKATNLFLQGKRKIPVGRIAGTKQIDAKKKKREKEKEADNPDEKSSAWKAYMDEVKKYKEMSCTDDSESNRPLVK